MPSTSQAAATMPAPRSTVRWKIFLMMLFLIAVDVVDREGV